MLPAFRQLSIKDKELIDRYFLHADSLLGQYDFTYWLAFPEPAEIAFFEDALYLRAKYIDKMLYMMPLCLKERDPARYIEVIADCEPGGNYSIVGIFEQDIPRLAGINVQSSPDTDEYLYNSQDLIELPGKLYHKKRNHISNFEQTNSYIFREYEAADYSEVVNFTKRWCHEAIEDHCFELDSLISVLKNLSSINARCFVIEIEGRLAAYTVVSVYRNNLGQVHFEKADKTVDGLYTAINKYAAQEGLHGTVYINRQEDLGLPGLRKAKHSYYPAIIQKKNIIAVDVK